MSDGFVETKLATKILLSIDDSEVTLHSAAFMVATLLRLLSQEGKEDEARDIVLGQIKTALENLSMSQKQLIHTFGIEEAA